MRCFILVALFAAFVASARVPLTVVVQGKRYNISADSGSEVTRAISKLTNQNAVGLRVLHKGKIINPNSKFSSLGIEAGAVLAVVSPVDRKQGVKLSTDSKKAQIQKMEMNETKKPETLDSILQELFDLPGKGLNLQSDFGKFLATEYMSKLFEDPNKSERLREKLLEALEGGKFPIPRMMMDQMIPILRSPAMWKLAVAEALTQMKNQSLNSFQDLR